MTRELAFAPIARDDLIDILSYINARSPTAADHVFTRFKSEFAKLIENPRLGHRDFTTLFGSSAEE